MTAPSSFSPLHSLGMGLLFAVSIAVTRVWLVEHQWQVTAGKHLPLAQLCSQLRGTCPGSHFMPNPDGCSNLLVKQSIILWSLAVIWRNSWAFWMHGHMKESSLISAVDSGYAHFNHGRSTLCEVIGSGTVVKALAAHLLTATQEGP